MSAYIVEDETINKIVAFLLFKAYHGNGEEWVYRPFLRLGYQLASALPDNTLEQEAERLAKDLFALNVAGVNARYGKDQAQEFRPLDFKYKSTLPPGQLQAIKSMQCLSYQCCEGDVPEQPLYKALNECIGNCCRDWVTSSEAYERCKWG